MQDSAIRNRALVARCEACPSFKPHRLLACNLTHSFPVRCAYRKEISRDIPKGHGAYLSEVEGQGQ